MNLALYVPAGHSVSEFLALRCYFVRLINGILTEMQNCILCHRIFSFHHPLPHYVDIVAFVVNYEFVLLCTCLTA